jgi:hypothetical protein
VPDPRRFEAEIANVKVKNGDDADCRNYEISLLSTLCKMLLNTLLSRLSPYIDAIIGDNLCGFPCSRSIINQTFFIHQILQKKWEYNELFINFTKTYNSVRREVLQNILIEFSITIKLDRLIKMCLNETLSKVNISEHLSDSFLIQNDLKQGRRYSITLILTLL